MSFARVSSQECRSLLIILHMQYVNLLISWTLFEVHGLIISIPLICYHYEKRVFASYGKIFDIAPKLKRTINILHL